MRMDLRGAFRAGTWLAAGCLLAGLLMLPAPAQAQTGVVTGTVVDRSTRQPLSGAQVSVKGTQLGSLTDSKGRFRIADVPLGSQTVQAVYIGYRMGTQAVSVTATRPAVADFRLALSAVALQQVVVTGTGGAIERRKLGTSVASVDAAQVEANIPVQSVGQLLDAQTPGVRSVATTGGLGSSRDLRIRGIGSFTLNQRPIIYIDGVRVDTNEGEWGSFSGSGTACCAISGGSGEDRLADLNPDDIDHIEIIKGAAAATLYGSEASNGVIQIFTKKGRSGEAPHWTFKVGTGFQRYRANFPTKLFPEFQGPNGFHAWDANKHLIQNGWAQNLQMTVRGGGRNVTYFVGGGFSNANGSLQPNGQKKGNLRVNLQWLPSQKWSFSVTSGYVRNRVEDLQSGNNWTALLGNAVLGNPRHATAARPYGEPWVSVHDIQQIQTFDDADHYTGGLTIRYTTSKTVSNRLTVGLDATNEQKTRFMPFGYPYVYVPSGEKDDGFRNFRSWTFDYLGNFNINVSKSVESQLSWGAQGFWRATQLNMAVGKDFAAPGVSVVNGGSVTHGAEQYRKEIEVGGLAQERLSFWDKLYATVGLRVDGNSAFGVNYGYQAYPKADVAYLISQEKFIPSFISTLKLRAAMGKAGKAPGAFDQFRTFQPVPVLHDQPGVSPANPGNPNLHPEQTTEIEGGFDAGFFQDRVGLTFTYYYDKTTDALVPVALPPSEGFSNAQLRNIGQIANKGWELSANATVVDQRNFQWSTKVGLDGNSNKVLTLGDTAIHFLSVGDGRAQVGYPVGAVWGFQPKPGSYDPQTKMWQRTDTMVYIGSPLPTFDASWSNTFDLGPFRFYTVFSMNQGAVFSNGGRRYRVNFKTGDEYLSTLDSNLQPTATSDSLYNYMRTFNAYDSRNAVRWTEASLAYQLPRELSNRLGLGSTSVIVSGENLDWWDHCHCMDPNQNWQGGSSFATASGFLAMPSPRTFRFTVQTTF